MTYERKITSPERFFAHSPFSIVTMLVRIKGVVSAEALLEAVQKVQRRHALLRVRIRYENHHEQWFTSEGVQEIPVEIVPRQSDDHWIEVHTQALKVPFEFQTRPVIRLILLQSPEISDLIILCHHMICDGMSLAYLARDLMVHLGDPGREVEVLPPPDPLDLDNLPEDVSASFLVRWLIKRMNQGWVEEQVLFDDQDYRAVTSAYWENFDHKILPVELSEAETLALVARCKNEQVTVNSALTAAFCGAQSFVEGEQPYHSSIVVAASLRDRIPNSPGEGIGMYAGGVELKYVYDHRRGFWENAGNFHKVIQPKYTNKVLFSDLLNWLYLEPTIFEAMNFKKLGGLVPSDSPCYEKLSTFSQRNDVVLRMLQRDKLESLDTKYWGTAITNLGRLDFPKTYGELELDRLILQPGGGIPLVNANLVLGAVTCGGNLSLVLEYAGDTSTMEKVRDKAKQYLFGE